MEESDYSIRDRGTGNNRTARIVALRTQGLLLWEIAELLGITKERVRQILVKEKARGRGAKSPMLVPTSGAFRILGLSLETRTQTFKRLMTRLGIYPIAEKKGRLYWPSDILAQIKPPDCIICKSPISLQRCIRASRTCSSSCAAQEGRSRRRQR